jgi:hypothetical protein
MTKLLGSFRVYANAPENLKEREHSEGIGVAVAHVKILFKNSNTTVWIEFSWLWKGSSN